MRSKPDTPARGLASRSSIAASTIIPTWLAASSTGKVSSRPRILTTPATAHTWPASRLETARRPPAFTAASPWRASYRSAHFGRQWSVQRQRRDRRHRSRHRPQEPIQHPRDQSLDRAAHFRKLRFGPAVRGRDGGLEKGIVVVTAAGNLGRNGYATITSPGNDLYAITVGGMKTE